MKISHLILTIATTALALGSLEAQAAKEVIQGSDTLAGVLTDAIIAAGMDQEVSYVGGGSGTGEMAVVNGTQGFAPMSRLAKSEALASLATKGVKLTANVIGLDGIGVFVNSANKIAGLDLATVKQIFTCQITTWEQVHGATSTGLIHVYRRNDQSGTTDTFKNLVGVSAFGACVTVVAETADIAQKTSTDPNAVGYAGLSAKRPENANLAISKTGGDYVVPTTATIRTGTYPLARKLYIYVVGGAQKPNEVETRLLSHLLDRSFLDPILQDNEFITVN